MPTDTPSDYTAVIRAQIERDVRRLKRDLERRASAQYVELGYLVNSHHGQRIYGEGDLICGVPVSTSGTNPRSIRVCADDVSIDVPQGDAYDGMAYTLTRDLYEETTW